MEIILFYQIQIVILLWFLDNIYKIKNILKSTHIIISKYIFLIIKSHLSNVRNQIITLYNIIINSTQCIFVTVDITKYKGRSKS